MASNRITRAAASRGKGYGLIDMGKRDEAKKAYRESLTIEPIAKPVLDELKYIQHQRAHPNRGKI
jgi:hypothetical protein